MAQLEDLTINTTVKGVISDAHAEEVVAAVNRLEDLASVRKLMELLRGATQKAQAA